MAAPSIDVNELSFHQDALGLPEAANSNVPVELQPLAKEVDTAVDEIRGWVGRAMEAVNEGNNAAEVLGEVTAHGQSAYESLVGIIRSNPRIGAIALETGHGHLYDTIALWMEVLAFERDWEDAQESPRDIFAGFAERISTIVERAADETWAYWGAQGIEPQNVISAAQAYAGMGGSIGVMSDDFAEDDPFADMGRGENPYAANDNYDDGERDPYNMAA